MGVLIVHMFLVAKEIWWLQVIHVIFNYTQNFNYLRQAQLSTYKCSFSVIPSVMTDGAINNPIELYCSLIGVPSTY